VNKCLDDDHEWMTGIGFKSTADINEPWHLSEGTEEYNDKPVGIAGSKTEI
jgi:hypothetical protein